MAALEFQLTPEQRNTLLELQLNHHWREVRRRATGLLLIADQVPASVIQDTLQVSLPSLYAWVRQWRQVGIVGLLAVSRHGGRKLKLPQEWIDRALTLATDQAYSARQISQVLEEEFKQSLPCTLETLRNTLKSGGMTYKRTRASLKKKE